VQNSEINGPIRASDPRSAAIRHQPNGNALDRTISARHVGVNHPLAVGPEVGGKLKEKSLLPHRLLPLERR
jgi:hypothetical protein